MDPESDPTQSDTDPLEAGAALRSLAAGKLIAGRFRLESLLGRGGMGVVWRAFDESLSKPRALKFLAEAVAQDRMAIAELKAEVARCQELTHPNILRVHDLIEDKELGVVAVSMEVAAGGTINSLRADRPYRWFEPQELSEWLTQLCAALDYAHCEAGIVHRDLKPANLLLDDKGRIKIADFGISRAVSESVTRITGAGRSTSGTPAYMSPQQASGQRASPSDDIYSLGASLYDLLTGKPPYLGGHHGIVLHQLLDSSVTPPRMSARRRELQEVESAIPEEWERVVAACLAKDPDVRPSSAGRVIALLAGTDEAAPVEPLVKLVPATVDSQGRRISLSASLGSVAAGASSGTTQAGESKGAWREAELLKNRGCTFTVALTFCLTVMLGGYFVKESIDQAKRPRLESASVEAPNVQEAPQANPVPEVPAPPVEPSTVPATAPQPPPNPPIAPPSPPAPDPRIQPKPVPEESPRATPKLVSTPAPKRKPLPRPGEKPPRPQQAEPIQAPPRRLAPPRSFPGSTIGEGSGSVTSEPRSTPKPVSRPEPTESAKARAKVLTQEGAALLQRDLPKARAKAVAALDYWPECVEARELLMRVIDAEVARDFGGTRSTPTPAPRKLPGAPGG